MADADGTGAGAPAEAGAGAPSGTLGARLAGLRRARGTPRPRTGGHGLLLAGLALALLAGGATYLVASAGGEDEDGLTASRVEAFQSAASTGGRIVFPEDEPAPRPEAPPITVEVEPDEGTAPSPMPAAARPDNGLALELAELKRALRDSEAAREEEARARRQADEAALAEARRLFDERQAALDAERDEAVREARDAASEVSGELKTLRAELAAERSRRDALQTQLTGRQEDLTARQLAEQRRRDLEEARLMSEAERRELLARQVASPAVVYAEGTGRAGGGGGTGPSPAPPGGGEDGVDLTASEAYLASAPPLVVQQAERLADPDRTLVQGTVIQAVLQDAVSSELPGNVTAVVSEPVPAFSGDAVLVPRGSRLFGSYRAGMQAGQRRVLIRWSRVLTPDGASMEISSVGGDGLGRSGLSGFVDTRFRERFGGAALISLIDAAPGLAASGRGGGGEGTDLVLDTGGDLAGTASSALDRQLAIAPTIHVPQGAAVTVIVDRDVVVR